jgi:hypothetical protein
VSDLTTKFLQQLRGDLQLLADDSCPISSRLNDLVSRLEMVEQGGGNVITWDKERGRLLITSSHPAVKTLINSPARRRSDVVFFISTLATFLNREEPDITDEHERAFHAKLLRFALEHATGSWSA